MRSDLPAHLFPLPDHDADEVAARWERTRELIAQTAQMLDESRQTQLGCRAAADRFALAVRQAREELDRSWGQPPAAIDTASPASTGDQSREAS